MSWSYAGGEHHSLALTADGEVFSFGRGDNNQLGYDDGTDQQLEPRAIPALKGISVRKVSTLANSNFAISKSGVTCTRGDLARWASSATRRRAMRRAPRLSDVPSDQAVLDAASGAQHDVYLVMERPD